MCTVVGFCVWNVFDCSFLCIVVCICVFISYCTFSVSLTPYGPMQCMYICEQVNVKPYNNYFTFTTRQAPVGSHSASCPVGTWDYLPKAGSTQRDITDRVGMFFGSFCSEFRPAACRFGALRHQCRWTFKSAGRSIFSEFVFNLRALYSNFLYHEETFDGSVLISSLIS